MFTGIITNLAEIVCVEECRQSRRFSFRFMRPEKNLKLGASIAVSGVCLTVAEIQPLGFTADVVGETLKATLFGSLTKGDYVNIERSLKVSDELGGHFVTGHVDGLGKILRVEKKSHDMLYQIEVPVSIRKFMFRKGSVTVNGVSLTIQDFVKKNIWITVIPHTMAATTFKWLKKNDRVNLEADLIARQFASRAAYRVKKEPLAKSLSIVNLKRQGF